MLTVRYFVHDIRVYACVTDPFQLILPNLYDIPYVH